MRKMIYVAGPYTTPASERLFRYNALTRAAAEIMLDGNLVYSPITHTHPLDLLLAEGHDDGTLGSDYWCDLDERFMAICDECVVIKLDGWQQSRGVAREIKFFETRNIPIVYVDPSDFVLGKSNLTNRFRKTLELTG